MQDFILVEIKFWNYLLFEQEGMRINVQKPEQSWVHDSLLPCGPSRQGEARSPTDVDVEQDQDHHCDNSFRHGDQQA